jgi:hypothetical protein
MTGASTTTSIVLSAIQSSGSAKSWTRRSAWVPDPFAREGDHRWALIEADHVSVTPQQLVGVQARPAVGVQHCEASDVTEK